MKYCLAVEEILRKEVVVDAGSLEAAERALEEAYCKGQIVLGAEDLVPNADTGEEKRILEADWYDTEEVQSMRASLTA